MPIIADVAGKRGLTKMLGKTRDVRNLAEQKKKGKRRHDGQGGRSSGMVVVEVTGGVGGRGREKNKNNKKNCAGEVMN